jgi:methylglutamate dehydrogenase subunit D
MLERRSALAGVKPVSGGRVSLGEVRGFTLTQVAALDDAGLPAVAAVLGELPRHPLCGETGGRRIFHTAPRQYWIVGPEGDDIGRRLAGAAIVTPLSHSRSLIFIEGPAAQEMLAKVIEIDLHETVFKPGMFAMTGLHHTPVLLHRATASRFAIYAMRTFALNAWEVLADAALEFQ